MMGKREILTTEELLAELGWSRHRRPTRSSEARSEPLPHPPQLKTGPSVQLLKKVGRMDAGCQVVGRPRRDR